MFSRIQPVANSNNPRKRLKRAHSSSDSEDAAAAAQSYPQPTMSLPPTTLPATTASIEKQPCHHQQTLQRLEPDLDTMRQLITCKICQRFLSEPYGLACGHTYCYVCLDAWLVAQKKRTCPDCRAQIKQQPVPSFLIREMTRVFAYRAELLPDGETVEEHDEYIKEAVAKVATDKEGRGLFSGLFKHGERLQWVALRDPGDGVDRCPNCHWELEEGYCGSCGLHVGDEDGFGLSTDEEEDDELDDDVMPRDHDGIDDTGEFEDDDYDDGTFRDIHGDGENEDIDIDAFGVLPVPAHRRPRHRPYRINLDSEPESEDSEDPDNDPQMEGFLDDEEIEELDSDSSQMQSDSEEEAEETPRNRPRQIIRPMVIHDSDDDIPQQTRRPVVIHSSGSEEEGPVVRHSQRAGKVTRGTRRPVVLEIESDSGEDTSDDEDEEEDEDGHQSNNAAGSDEEDGSESDAEDYGGVNAGMFSPVQSERSDDEQGNYGTYDDHEEDAQEGSEDDEVEDFGPDATAFAADDDGYGQYMDPYDDDGDGGRNTRIETTPPQTAITPIETTLTHRLLKRQQRRRRSANRDSATEPPAVSAAGPSSSHRQESSQSHRAQVAEPSGGSQQAQHQHQHQRRMRMRRVQGRDSLR